MDKNAKNAVIVLVIEEVINAYVFHICAIAGVLAKLNERKRKRVGSPKEYTMISRFPTQEHHLNRMTVYSDTDCINNLRMDRNCFGRLCVILKQLGGLEDGRYVSVEEQVALFLGILAHHKKNREVSFNFWRSGQTISLYVHKVLRAILKIHATLLQKPTPLPEDSVDPRWRWFKGCLGALDGSYINVMVCNADKPRYRTRKGEIATNTLAVCDRNLRFVYVLAGWEGSAADGRILRDAINRENGLKVPRGSYYLCDNGYANSDGFLTPYKGHRYHLKEWGPDSGRPQNKEELFNLRHSKARNVIERAFGIMKMRWGILRSSSYYPIKMQIRLIMACFLLHNYIRGEMAVDPIEGIFEECSDDNTNNEHDEVDYVDMVEATTEWSRWRDDLAEQMWLDYAQ